MAEQQRTLRQRAVNTEVPSQLIAVPTKFAPTTGTSVDFVSPQRMMLEKQTEDTMNTMNAVDLIQGVFEFADRTIPAKGSGREAVVAGIGRVAGRTNVARLMGLGNEPARDFELTKQAFGTLIARGLGEKGVVTNRDVFRVLKSLPREDDTIEGRTRRKEFILQLLNNRINRYNQTVQALKASVGGKRKNVRTFADNGQMTSEKSVLEVQE